MAHVVYPTSAASLSVTLTAFVALSREVELAVGSMRMLGLLGVLHVWNVVATAVVGYVLAVNPFHPLPQVGAVGFLRRPRNPQRIDRELRAGLMAMLRMCLSVSVARNHTTPQEGLGPAWSFSG